MTTTFFFWPLSALSAAAARMASTDSFFASSTNPQVFTMTASASSWSSTTSNPLLKRSPSITSPSTVFLGQPKDTMDTFARFSSSLASLGFVGSAMEARGTAAAAGDFPLRPRPRGAHRRAREGDAAAEHARGGHRL